MEDLSLHILDIAENAVRAKAGRIEIDIVEDTGRNLLSIRIKDDGQGMDEETQKRSLDPFFTTKQGRKVGLGLSMLAQAAKQASGKIKLDSQIGEGTSVRADFQYDHPDRKPLGDINQTLAVLIAGHPEIDFIYEHRINGEVNYKIDTTKSSRQ